MVEQWWRNVWYTVRVGGEEITLRMSEEYSSENPGMPVRVVIGGPNGLKTEGDPATAWREMLELLGVESPAPTVAAAQPLGTQANEASGPQIDGVTEVQQACPTPAAGKGEILAPLSKTGEIGVYAAETIESDEVGSEEDEVEEDMKAAEADDDELNPNILQESMIRMLNQRVYSDDPPAEITPEVIAELPHISCTQEAADVIDVIDENIKLNEMRGDAARRAARLKDLERANRAKRCTHVKFNGEKCGSPALRGQQYCHFHAQAHAPSVDIPVIEDQHSLQVAFTRLAHQVASNKIEPAQAKVLLQILESAGRNLPEQTSEW